MTQMGQPAANANPQLVASKLPGVIGQSMQCFGQPLFLTPRRPHMGLGAADVVITAFALGHDRLQDLLGHSCLV